MLKIAVAVISLNRKCLKFQWNSSEMFFFFRISLLFFFSSKLHISSTLTLNDTQTIHICFGRSYYIYFSSQTNGTEIPTKKKKKKKKEPLFIPNNLTGIKCMFTSVQKNFVPQKKKRKMNIKRTKCWKMRVKRQCALLACTKLSFYGFESIWKLKWLFRRYVQNWQEWQQSVCCNK